MRKGAKFTASWALTGALLGISTLTACSQLSQADEPLSASIAVVVPGGQSAAGNNSAVADAVQSALNELDIAGWMVEVTVIDSDAVTSELPLEALPEDVVAVVGGVTNNDVLKLAPSLAEREILFVTPLDDDVAHTRGPDPATPVRPFSTYYSMSSGDDDPLHLLANYAINGRDLTSFGVVDAGDLASRTSFALNVRQADGKVPVSASIDPGRPETAATVVAQLEEEKVDALFVSGEKEAAAAFVHDVRDAGLEPQVLVAPALAGGYLKAFDKADRQGDVAGASNEAISATAATTTVEGTGEVLGLEVPGPYGAAAYDAGTAIRTVLTRCLPSADSALDARDGCAGEMREVAFEGVTGDVAFNDYGERSGALPEVVVARDGDWQPVR